MATHRSVASPTLSALYRGAHAGCRMSAGMRDSGTPAMERLRLTSLAAAGTELRSHPIVVGIGAAAVACAALAAASIQRGQLRGDDPSLATFTVVAGVSFVSAGLVASARRRERWTGALMVGAGFALFAGTLIRANQLGAVHARPGFARDSRGSARASRPRLPGRAAPLELGASHRRCGLFQRGRGPGRDAHVHAASGRSAVARARSNLLFTRDDMTVHMRLMSIERYAGHRRRGSRPPRPGSALASRLASAQTRAFPDPGQRRSSDRAARSDPDRERAALPGRSDQAAVRGTIGVRRRADRLSRGAVARADGPGGSQRSGRGTEPRPRAWTATRRDRPFTARPLTGGRVLDPRTRRVRGRGRTAPSPSFRLRGVP